MPKKCPECNGEMKKTASGVYECEDEECGCVYITKGARDTIKSIFGVTRG